MALNELPYEIQFKYLANLPFKDTVGYFSTSVTAYTICQTKAFWKYKARKTFGIDLDIIGDGKKTGVEKYRTLESLYRKQPWVLIERLVNGEDLSQIPVLFNTIPNVNDQHMAFTNALVTAVVRGSISLVQQILTILKNVYINLPKRDLDDLFRDAFFQALVDDRMDLVNILKFYYDPNTDNDENLFEWLRQWDYHKDPKMLDLLAKQVYLLIGYINISNYC